MPRTATLRPTKRDNTSVQDAYNLAWKLSLVLAGKATDGLLDSYDAERQPVGRQVVDRANQSVLEMGPWLAALGLQPDDWADGSGARLTAIFGPDGEALRQELLGCLTIMNGQFDAHGVELGQRYISGAVVDNGCTLPALRTRSGAALPPLDPPGGPAASCVAMPRHHRRVHARSVCVRPFHRYYRCRGRCLEAGGGNCLR